MYELLIEGRAEKDLKKLEQDLFNQVTKKILELKTNPRPYGSKKITGSKDDWRIRIGDYRVVYEIDDKNRIVRLYRIKHRKEDYK